MVGYFRLIKNGKPVFYEILTLFEREGSVEMRLKHVNPDMTGWEDKGAFVTVPLVKPEKDGYELLRQLRRDHHDLADLPVMALTCTPRQRIRNALSQQDFSSISKPV